MANENLQLNRVIAPSITTMERGNVTPAVGDLAYDSDEDRLYFGTDDGWTGFAQELEIFQTSGPAAAVNLTAGTAATALTFNAGNRVNPDNLTVTTTGVNTVTLPAGTWEISATINVVQTDLAADGDGRAHIGGFIEVSGATFNFGGSYMRSQNPFGTLGTATGSRFYELTTDSLVSFGYDWDRAGTLAATIQAGGCILTCKRLR